jgi:phosphotriesterase-related protein
MAVMTVAGPVADDELGVVLPHEHLVSDVRAYYSTPDDPVLRAIGDGPVVIEHLGLLRRNLFAVRDNLVLGDLDTAIAEVAAFAGLGGGTIVDTTPPDGGRDPLALAEIARRAGVHVVMGSGHYIHPVHPPSPHRPHGRDGALALPARRARRWARRCWISASRPTSAPGWQR